VVGTAEGGHLAGGAVGGGQLGVGVPDYAGGGSLLTAGLGVGGRYSASGQYYQRPKQEEKSLHKQPLNDYVKLAPGRAPNLI
jgi:hypothetical protein